MRGRSLSCAWYTSTLKQIGYCPTLLIYSNFMGDDEINSPKMKQIIIVLTSILLLFSCSNVNVEKLENDVAKTFAKSVDLPVNGVKLFKQSETVYIGYANLEN